MDRYQNRESKIQSLTTIFGKYNKLVEKQLFNSNSFPVWTVNKKDKRALLKFELYLLMKEIENLKKKKLGTAEIREK